jgi:hypothetical protein
MKLSLPPKLVEKPQYKPLQDSDYREGEKKKKKPLQNNCFMLD